MSKLAPFIGGLVVAAVVVPVGGFTFGGWVPGGKARVMAEEAASAAVRAALVPVCVDRFRADPNAASNLALMKDGAQSPYSRMRVVLEGGWADSPKTGNPVPGLADDCAKALVENTKNTT